MTKINIQTKGMHCASCEMLVTDAIEEIDGVNNVEVSHKTGKVIVDFDESKTDKNKIIDAIKKEGFDVK